MIVEALTSALTKITFSRDINTADNPRFHQGKIIQRVAINDVLLDASITETHQGDAEVTEHPIETGGNIVDHVRPKAETLTLEGIISNTPIAQGKHEEDTVQGNYNRLRAMKDEGQLLTIRTRLRTYANMVMTSFQVPRNAQTGDVLRFTATFKQIRFVTNQTAMIAKTKVAKAKPIVDKGPQGKDKVEEHEKRASSIVKILDHFVGTGR